MFMEIFHFYLREIKFKNAIKLFAGHVVHINACLKQALNHRLILKKVHRVIQFNQKAWLKPYINLNTKLRAEVKNDFEKDFVKLMIILFSERPWEM